MCQSCSSCPSFRERTTPAQISTVLAFLSEYILPRSLFRFSQGAKSFFVTRLAEFLLNVVQLRHQHEIFSSISCAKLLAPGQNHFMPDDSYSDLLVVQHFQSLRRSGGEQGA